jgi:hypothetical protein
MVRLAHSGNTLYRSLARAFACSIVLASATAHADSPPSAGTIVLVAGPVHIQQGEVREELVRGTHIFPGQTLVTGEGGFAHIQMADGGLVALRPLSTFELDVFDYRRDAGTDRVRYRLEEGVARSITGAVGESNKEAFRLNTPVAAVGVRGTDFVVATDSTTSRVAINSGAVVVAALGAGCSAEGFGACAHDGVLLGAGTSVPGQYVEVVRGNPTPRMIENTDATPDRVTPPHPEEPRLNRVQPERPSEVAQNSVPQQPVAPLPPEPILPEPLPPGTLQPPGVVKAESAHWGRWSKTIQPSELGIVTAVATLVGQGRTSQVGNDWYAGGVTSPLAELPRSGQVDFWPAGGEAMLVSAAGVGTVLSVGAGRLGVNFDTRSFESQVNFNGNNQAYTASSAGDITTNGRLVSNAALSDSSLRGVINSDLSSAATVISKPLSEGAELNAVVTWGRR